MKSEVNRPIEETDDVKRRRKSKPCILIVEDHETLRELLRSYFEHQGYPVKAADSYERALVLAAENPPDVAVCDRQLGGDEEARDGVDTARVLQSTFGAAIVFVTGTSMTGLRAATPDLEVAEYLQKPVLAERIERAVREAAAQSCDG